MAPIWVIGGFTRQPQEGLPEKNCSRSSENSNFARVFVTRECTPPPNRLCFVCSFVCLFVLAGLCKNCSTHFHKFWWKDGSGAKEERLDFGGNPDHVTLGSGLPHLWNQLPVSFRQPCTKHPADDVTLSNSPSTYSPLSPSITHSLFHSRLKTHLFH